MYGRRAPTRYQAFVQRAGIALMLCELIVGIHLIHYLHDPVAQHLRDHRRRDDRRNDIVAAYDRFLRDAQLRYISVTFDEYQRGLYGQFFYRTFLSPERCLQDIYPVDHRRAASLRAPYYSAAADKCE